MIKYIIVVTMFFINPVQFGENDAVEIESYKGRPLQFEKQSDCYEHVEKNLEKIKEFAIYTYRDKPGALVKQIICAETDKIAS